MVAAIVSISLSFQNQSKIHAVVVFLELLKSYETLARESLYQPSHESRQTEDGQKWFMHPVLTNRKHLNLEIYWIYNTLN